MFVSISTRFDSVIVYNFEPSYYIENAIDGESFLELDEKDMKDCFKNYLCQKAIKAQKIGQFSYSDNFYLLIEYLFLPYTFYCRL